MSAFLDQYGVGDEQREKRIKLIVLFVVVALVLAGVLYLVLRDVTEKRQVTRFLELLRNKDYEGAYALWGCTPQQPCRDYPMNKFLEDWGPASPHANAAEARLERKQPCGTRVIDLWIHAIASKFTTPSTCSCDRGIIRTVVFPGGEQVDLWVERKDNLIGFAPWPICAPRMTAP